MTSRMIEAFKELSQFDVTFFSFVGFQSDSFDLMPSLWRQTLALTSKIPQFL